jgi:type II secretory ATPase GspE/PulE/Tfp pilus assembly ATPase PilB-like protein
VSPTRQNEWVAQRLPHITELNNPTNPRTLMQSNQILSTLRSVPLFQHLTEADLRPILQQTTVSHFLAGDIVTRAGESGAEMHIILEGNFELFARSERIDFEKKLANLGPGDYFGEIALLTGERRTASIRAVTGGQTLVLHKEQLGALLERAPAAALALCRGMASYVVQLRAAQSHSGETIVPFIDLDDHPQAKEFYSLIPPRVSLLCRAAAYRRQGDEIGVALVDPHDESLRAFIRQVLRQFRVAFAAISERDFDRYRDVYLGQLQKEVISEEAVAQLTYVNRDGVAAPLGQHETDLLLQDVLGQAIRFGASDVHFEPGVTKGRVRLRIDGNVVSRLKVLGELDITCKRLPQDGRFSISAASQEIEMRVAVTPCHGGEKVVLRLLNPSQQMALHHIVLVNPVALLIKEMFLSPSGLVLVCGPTGSGKTTTLYAGLNELWKESQAINIVTVEDPVEYHLEQATQIGVNRAVGLDFPHILRSVLRQDPDIILIGEIRDTESAEIALEAATTGRLVLSSLHTDFALEAIARLRNLQAKSYLVANALRGVISQKLVPRVCKNCARPVSPDDRHIVRLHQLGIFNSSSPGELVRGGGCDLCRSLGEIGRVAAFEILSVTDALRNLIEESASREEMNSALDAHSFVSMQRYSRFLLEEGIVAPERIAEIFPTKRFSETVDALSQKLTDQSGPSR